MWEEEEHQPVSVILVAEDDQDDIFFLRHAWRKEGVDHLLRFVKDGQYAIDYLEGKPPYSNRQDFPLPGLLITDLKMPRLGGFGLIEWIRNSDEFRRLPIIVLSNSELPADRDRATRLGAAEYHPKLCDSERYQTVMRGICQRWVWESTCA